MKQHYVEKIIFSKVIQVQYTVPGLNAMLTLIETRAARKKQNAIPLLKIAYVALIQRSRRIQEISRVPDQNVLALTKQLAVI